MTCGGIIFLAGLIFGGVWLSNSVNSNWPLALAIVLVTLLIILRVGELIFRRSEQRRYEREVVAQTLARAELNEAALVIRHVQFFPNGNGATFRRLQDDDGGSHWQWEYDDGVEYSVNVMLKTDEALAKLNSEFGYEK